MATSIFVNLPVKDLKRSIEFFTKLGFTFNPRFTNENATCMVVSEDIYFMLLLEKYFKTFIRKEIVDSTKSTEVINAISVESRVKVDELVEKALKTGAKSYRDPEDHGWMYGRAFEDLDGHLWEVFSMDIEAMEKGQ